MKKLKDFILNYYVHLIFLVSGLGTFGSLYFSEIQGLVPCALCWYQRIFLYPIFFLTATSIGSNQPIPKRFLIALSVPGAIIGFYQWLTQMFPMPDAFVVCTGGVDCSKIDWTLSQIIPLDFLNFVTLPFLSFLAFLFIVLILLVVFKFQKPSKL